MAAITVRGLDNDVVDRLERRASRNDRSLEDEALHILKHATADETEDDDKKARRTACADEMKRLRHLTEGLDPIPGVEAIRAGRGPAHRDDI